MAGTFDGNAIFGAAVQMTEGETPAGFQETGYPQLHGVEGMALGGRARMTFVNGILVATDGAALEVLKDVFRVYEESGGAYVLVTTTGGSFPYCVMRGFRTTGPVFSYAGGVGQQYQVSFRHLT